MLATPFLTSLDSRAAVKGSRDPLGVQPIWSRLGRQVIGNLTTVTNSVRDFTVLLLGHYFVELLADTEGTGGDLGTFLKWEQLAAYARSHVGKEGGFRGVERVERRLREGEKVRLSADAEAQILGNQKTYGLWGLYTVPAKASGLLQGDPTRLTAEARAFVERRLVPELESVCPRAVRGIVERLKPKEYELDLGKRDAAILAGVAHVVTIGASKSFYQQHLVYGGEDDLRAARGTQGRQRLFAELLSETFPEEKWRPSPPALRHFASRAREKGDVGQELAVRLERVRTAELLLAPAVAFFEHVLGCDGQNAAEVASTVRQHWGERPRETIDTGATEELWRAVPTLSDDPDAGPRWCQLAAAFHGARYEDAIRLVLEQNAAVMKARASFAPWAVLQENGQQRRIQVKFRDQNLGHLPGADELPTLWRHAYFIESLRTVAAALEGAA